METAPATEGLARSNCRDVDLGLRVQQYLHVRRQCREGRLVVGRFEGGRRPCHEAQVDGRRMAGEAVGASGEGESAPVGAQAWKVRKVQRRREANGRGRRPTT